MNRYYARADTSFFISWMMVLAAVAVGAVFFGPYNALAAHETGHKVKVAILIYGDNRQETLAGFQAEMDVHNREWQHGFVYDIKALRATGPNFRDWPEK